MRYRLSSFIFIAVLCVCVLPRPARAAFAPDPETAAVEAYQAAQQAYLNQLVSYKNGRDNWKDFRIKHKDLSDPTQTQIALEEAKSYTSKSLTAYKAYLVVVRTRIGTITSIDDQVTGPMYLELDAAIGWLESKNSELGTGSWTLDALRELANEFSTFRDSMRTTIWHMIDTLMLSRIDRYIQSISDLLPQMDQALLDQSHELTIAQIGSLTSSISAVRNYVQQVREDHDSAFEMLVPEADLTTLQTIHAQTAELIGQVDTLKKMVARITAPAAEVTSGSEDEAVQP